PAADEPRSSDAGNGHGNGHGNGSSNGSSGRPGPFGLGRRPEIPYVSPLRGGRLPATGPLELPGTAAAAPPGAGPAGADPAGAAPAADARAADARAAVAVAAPATRIAPIADLPQIAPPEPVLTHADDAPDQAAAERDVEPALPDEARDRAASVATSPTIPLEVASDRQILHVRFSRGPSVQLVPAMESLRQVIRERPGETSVVVHVPGPGGALLPMPLRTPVAYDAELLAEIHRRLGHGLVDLSLA
ncbi:MAG TPA: hypothetical protein VGI98_05585, partial [Candidatus Limnocylindrales bacterium]